MMGCVTRTARRRRLMSRMDERYKYGRKSASARDKRLQALIAKERAVAARKGKKKA